MSDNEHEDLEARIQAAVAKAFESQLPSIVSKIRQETAGKKPTEPRHSGGGKYYLSQHWDERVAKVKGVCDKWYTVPNRV